MLRTFTKNITHFIKQSLPVLLVAIAFPIFSQSQTVLISPTGDGGFENGTTFSANGWTEVNYSSTSNNNWVLGTGAGGYSGNRAAYVSNNSAAATPPYTYSGNPSQTVHFYRDVTFPAGQSVINFSFSLRQVGENGWDRILVYISNGAPTGAPVTGTPASTSTTLAGYTLLLQTPQQMGSFATFNVPITAAQVGNALITTSRRILFVWQNDGSVAGTESGAIDNISLTTNCSSLVTGLSASNITVTGATLNWTALPGATSYTVRYKKPSDPITTLTWATPTPAATNTLVLTGLAGAYPYEFQVSSVGPTVCAAFTASANFTTACVGPTIASTTPGTKCGAGTVNLAATSSPGGTIRWYTAANGGAPLSTGNNFTTPPISNTTTYFAGAGIGSGTVMGTLGAGASNGTSWESPFYHLYGGKKSQYIIRASELMAAGFTAGSFTSLALDMVNGGNSYAGFEIQMGATAATAVSNSAFISGLTTVYAATATTTVGINTYTFSTPFVWDGLSNIVVQMCFSNNNGGGPSTTVKVDNPGFLCHNFYYADNQTASAICGSTTVNSTSSLRPKMILGNFSVCESGRVPVVATITPAPATTVTSPQSPGICPSGTASLTVSSPNSSYNYTWNPGALTGSTVNVSPTTSTTYIVSAVDPITTCARIDSIRILVSTVPPVPSLAPTSSTVCQGVAATLTATTSGGAAATGIVGTGTVVNSTYSYPAPFGVYYGGNHEQYLIRASELTAAGLFAGNLNSLAFDIASAYNSGSMKDYTIKIAPTALSAMSTTAFESTGFITVYSNTNYTPPSSTGWATTAFTTPFVWNGTSNIIIDVSFINCTSCNNTSSCGTSYNFNGNGIINQSTTPFVSTYGNYADGNCTIADFAPQPYFNVTSTSQRPNMQISGTGQSFAINWVNLSSLYKNAGLTNAIVANDTNKVVYAAPATTTSYTVVTTNNGCKSAPSNSAVVNVTPGPVSVISPSGPQMICPVNGSKLLTVPQVAGNTYQWKLGGVAISGATSSSYTATAIGSYTVTVTNPLTGCSSTSATPTVITISPLPTATLTAAGPTTFCDSGSVILNANFVSGFTYQFVKDTSLISGATASSYTAMTSGNYSVIVSNANGCSSTSAPISVTANVTPSNLTALGSTTFCVGGSLTLNAPVGTQYLYQFKRNGVNIAGATSNSYTIIGTAISTNTYSVTVTDTTTGCSSTTTPAVAVIVGTPPPATILPSAANQAVCAGSILTLTSNTAPGLSYQWYRNTVLINGATLSSYGVTSSGSYTVNVASGPGCSSTSTAINVIVNPLPTATASAAGNTTFCQGDSLLLEANNQPNVTYQWRINGNDIAGANGLQYTATQTGNFTVAVTNSSTGCVGLSNTIPVLVNPLPAASISAGGPLTVCLGNNVTLNAGNVTGRSYQWYNNTAVITGATNNTYVATVSGNYTVRVTNNATGCFANSAITVVTVNPVPSVVTTPAAGPNNLCQGSVLTLSIPVTLNSTYQWYKNNVAIAGANANTYYANTAGSYTVIATTTASGCTNTSAAIVITVNPVPVAATITATTGTVICQYDTVVLKANYLPTLTYQWLLGGAPILNANDTVFAATQGGAHAVSVTNSFGCSATSNVINLTVKPAPPAFITYNSPITFCKGSAVVLDASPGFTGLTYQWLRNGLPIGNTTNYKVADTTGNYQVRVVGANGCALVSPGVPVVVYPKPTPIITANGFIMDGGAGYSSYNWYRNGVGIGGATSRFYTAVQSGAYSVSVIDANGCEGKSEIYFINGVGIKQTGELASQIRVFPNPTNGLLYVEAPVKVNVQVLDVAGRSIYEMKDAKELNLKTFADGMYVLRIMDIENNLIKVQPINKATR